MGASPDNLDIIADLHSKGFIPDGAKVADIGAQQLRGATSTDVRRFLGYFRVEKSPVELERLSRHNVFISEHLAAAGFRYRSFDIVEAPACSYFDLNSHRVPRRWRGKFDLVLNFGTTEHVLNQLNAMRAMHDFAKPGGLIYSLFLRGGNMDHGLLHYSDRFVDLICRANQYEIVWRQDQTNAGNECTWIAMRKVSADSFSAPTDVEEGAGLPEIMRPYRRMISRWIVT